MAKRLGEQLADHLFGDATEQARVARATPREVWAMLADHLYGDAGPAPAAPPPPPPVATTTATRPMTEDQLEKLRREETEDAQMKARAKKIERAYAELVHEARMGRIR